MKYQNKLKIILFIFLNLELLCGCGNEASSAHMTFPIPKKSWTQEDIEELYQKNSLGPKEVLFRLSMILSKHTSQIDHFGEFLDKTLKLSCDQKCKLQKNN